MTSPVHFIHGPGRADLLGLRIFLLLILGVALRYGKILFFPKNGRSHRAAGATLFLWIALGTFTAVHPRGFTGYAGESLRWGRWCLFYDAVLGSLGIITTLTAAKDFPHRRVINDPGQSGTLQQAATVTQAEMVEHAFYQVVNLIQAVYLHLMTWVWELQNSPVVLRLLAVLVVTSPWWVRRRFPVHSFSANWTVKRPTKQTSIAQESEHFAGMEMLLYRVKKWQYIFYKHVILHGVNISVAFPARRQNRYSLVEDMLPLTSSWRIFWLALNMSYVMEFFMQSLVKRQVLTQGKHLWLQRLLMMASSISATGAILGRVRLEVSIASLLLNFSNRHHDVFNTMLVAAFASRLFGVSTK